MKQTIISIMLTMLISMVGANAFAYDIAVKDDNGVTIYYNWINNKTELSFTSSGYSKKYGGNISIPKYVRYEGKRYDVTSIGESAFYGYIYLTSITIPPSIKSIGNNAFSECNSLTKVNISNIYNWCNINFSSNPLFYAHHLFLNGEEVTELTIPNGVTSIGNSAFSNCYGLTSVTIPDGVTSIGQSAFYGCSGLTTLIIPQSVTSIGDAAFSGCGLTSVILHSSPTTIGSNVFGRCWVLEEVTFDCETVSDIFKGLSPIKKLTMTEKVLSIDKESFCNCSGLVDVTIPSTISSVGKDAFSGTAWYESQPDGLVYIGKIAYKFKGEMPANTSIILNDDTEGIADCAFENCGGLNSVTIPTSVTYIGKGAFNGCTELTSVNVPVIDLSSFCHNSIVSTIKYAIGKPIKLIDNKGKEIKEYIIPDDVTSIDYYSFMNCSGLTSLVIPNSVTDIGNYAFENCSGLTSVIIPNSVKFICQCAFKGCSGLTSITIPNSVTYITNDAFEDCCGLKSVVFDCQEVTSLFSGFSSIEEITLSGNVTSIEEEAFKDCCSLTSVIVCCNLTSIGDNPFSGCSNIENVTYDCEKVINLFQGITSIKQVIMTESVTSINQNAFSGCSGLNSVIIGSGVKSIGNNAFKDTNVMKCIWLTNTPPSGYNQVQGKVNYVSNNQYSSLNNTVQYEFLSSYFEVDGVIYVPVSPSERTCDAIDCVYDKSAENIIIDETVTNKGITLSVKKVNPYTCYKNQSIKDVKLSFSGDIGEYAFSSCSYMTTATINNYGNIGRYAFSPCFALKTVELGQKVTSIDSYAFSECEELQSIMIPDAVNSVGSHAFQKCSSLISATIGNGAETINDYAFSGCSALNELKIGSNVKTIESYAFSGCSILPSITIPQTVTDIKNGVFDGCNSLTEVIFSDSNMELNLGSNDSNPLFSSCPLDYVYIGRNINYNTSLNSGYSPFYCNTTLREVNITDKETEISENEFYGCSNLQKVTIGDGVTIIGNRAFSSCSSLKNFSFGTQMKNIGIEAFSDCTAVEELSSRASTPPVCGSQALNDINKWNCKLIVPKGYLKVYQDAEQWKEFFYIEEGDLVLKGDVNGDGVVNVIDIVETVNAIKGHPSAKYNPSNADMNYDGVVDYKDTEAISKDILKE